MAVPDLQVIFANAICGWLWMDAADLPDDGTKHRHTCGLAPRHTGNHSCRAPDGSTRELS